MERSYLRSAEAAEYMRLSRRTLEDLRYSGGGPKYYKMGPDPRSHVLYTKEDIDAWLDQRHVGSAAEFDAKCRRLFR